MDVNVDTEVLEYIQSRLKMCEHKMLSMTVGISSRVDLAGFEWEGQQYNTARETTRSACKTINDASRNLNEINAYLIRLHEDINEYFKCRFEE